MASTAGVAGTPELSITPIPMRQWLPWAAFAGIVMLMAVYFVGAEQGAVSLVNGVTIHEWMHDGRHLLGFPCH